MSVDDDIDMIDHRSLHPDLDGAGAGSYAPYVSYADLPKISVYRYNNDHLLPDVVHGPDAWFDYTEWESKYMLKPTFETDLGKYREWSGPTNSVFTPVIDERQIVIAHVGYTRASELFIPSGVDSNFPFANIREASTIGLLDERVNKYLAHGGVAYVTDA
jgi:hypothetical protein